MVIDRQFKSNVGLYLVAAKLSQMNLIALTTSRNTRGYDIVVLEPSTNKGRGIQVKRSDKSEFPVMQSYLKDYGEEIPKKIVCDFVFVDTSKADSPRFFVVPRDDLRAVMRQEIEEYLNGPHRKPLREMLETETNKQQWVVSMDNLLKYEGEWDILLRGLWRK